MCIMLWCNIYFIFVVLDTPNRSKNLIRCGLHTSFRFLADQEEGSRSLWLNRYGNRYICMCFGMDVFVVVVVVVVGFLKNGK